jgi:fructokinase
MILVCGEALIDLFLADAEGAAIPARAVAGGSPFNVAIGLSRLGQASAFCGGLSNDAFGQHLAGLLRTEGVDLSFSPVSTRLTTLSVVATDRYGHPAYAFHGEGKADRELVAADLPTSLPESITALVFGSYTLAVEPVGSAYLALARRESTRRVISLDPNVRPTVTPDMADWRRRFAEFLPLASIVKASDEDIALAYGAGASVEAVAAEWLAAGPGLVVVTRGKAGATAFTANGAVTVKGREVALVDTVGAGDTFHAALLARLNARGALTRQALRMLDPALLTDVLTYATAAASITCSRRGADLPRAAEVSAIMATT